MSEQGRDPEAADRVRTAIVTGSDSGIGKATAVALAEQGPDVARHGLGGLIKTFALELGRFAITANAVAPGEIAPR